jgi:hypothetical protein
MATNTPTPAPLTSIDKVWPNIGVPEGGMPVSLFGSGFSEAIMVTVDGASVPFTKTRDGRIDFIMPAGVDGTVVDIVVTTVGDSTMAANAFTYVAPVTASFNGNAGAVFTVTGGITVAVPPQGVDGMFVVTLTAQPPQPGVPGDVLMHAFRLDALLNWVPLASLTNPITIELPVDPEIVPAGERPWLYQWSGGEERGERSEEREEEGSALTSLSSGQWTLVPNQTYDAANRNVTVALRPMGLYALSTSLVRSYWLPLVPVLR